MRREKFDSRIIDPMIKTFKCTGEKSLKTYSKKIETCICNSYTTIRKKNITLNLDIDDSENLKKREKVITHFFHLLSIK